MYVWGVGEEEIRRSLVFRRYDGDHAPGLDSAKSGERARRRIYVLSGDAVPSGRSWLSTLRITLDEREVRVSRSFMPAFGVARAEIIALVFRSSLCTGARTSLPVCELLLATRGQRRRVLRVRSRCGALAPLDELAWALATELGVRVNREWYNPRKG
jgi:hypothetical protein